MKTLGDVVVEQALIMERISKKLVEFNDRIKVLEEFSKKISERTNDTDEWLAGVNDEVDRIKGHLVI